MSNLIFSSATRQFIRANLAYILSGKLRSKKGYRPQGGHTVPDCFSGVCVAAGPYTSHDDYLVELLRELGVHHVRLDFTYGDETGHTGRFLKRLIAESFRVNLHLVQPLADAREMHATAWQDDWREFVAETMQRYAGSIASIEIGTTVNRKRWSGYSVETFLIAWDIAYTEILPYDVPLAGPNVTDFEPFYNIGLLSILRSRKQLPDIHTDNLFSERCTEPERNDHKILGRRLAALGGFRLVKKAFMLQEIGARFGVPLLQSPSAFWTLPRIERLLPDSEQKQADYLARYMILCAASGALGSAAWGPLVCHREGLVDDGITQYPALERITWYAGIGEDLTHYRVRPAFAAYKAFIAHIPGLRYLDQLSQLAQLNGGDHLEVHAFSDNVSQLHAAWTTNGKATALMDIYAAASLSKAVFYSRDGAQLPAPPDLVTESPLYIRFAGSQPVNILPTAAVLDSLALHAHVQGKTYSVFRDDGWSGLVSAANAEEHDALRAALHPSNIGAPPKDALLRKARNAVWKIPDPRDANRSLVVKQPLKMHLHKKFLDRLKPSKAKKSWNGASELSRRGIGTAQPVAFFEKTGDTTFTQNYFICEYIPADFSARDMLSAFAAGASEFKGISTGSAYRQLCDFLLVMHGRGVYFRDLSGGNILIRQSEDNTLSFSLIDTNRAHFFDHGTVIAKRISDLTRVCNKLHWAGRKVFMGMYLGALGKQFTWRYRLPFHLYDAKVGFKRKFGRKAITRLFKPKKDLS
ncbi:MAG: lipopolysaccharide kinase InaA family protein [Pseudomonadota bacterium]